MSWDILAMDIPHEFKSVEEIPLDFKPEPLGARSAVIAKIKDVFPTADFSEPSWGLIDGDGWSIEVSMGKDEMCDGFALHVRSGDGAVEAVTRNPRWPGNPRHRCSNRRALRPRANGDRRLPGVARLAGPCGVGW